ncbi:MAG: glutathione S-transferase [Magnetovibrionaceae bacterium]
MTDRPILYSFRRCPYAMRARLALSVSGQVCSLREVVLRSKPPELLAASPKGTVPVLVLPGGDVIEESLEIMTWALTRNDPEGWLAPVQAEPEEFKALIAENDGPFKASLDRYKYPTRFEDVDPLEHRAEGLRMIEGLEERLGASCYLYGDCFSLADAAIAPFVRQFANTDRAWFDSLHLPGVHRWLSAFLESDRFIAIMGKYPAWENGQNEPLFPASWHP